MPPRPSVAHALENAAEAVDGLGGIGGGEEGDQRERMRHRGVYRAGALRVERHAAGGAPRRGRGRAGGVRPPPGPTPSPLPPRRPTLHQNGRAQPSTPPTPSTPLPPSSS